MGNLSSYWPRCSEESVLAVEEPAPTQTPVQTVRHATIPDLREFSLRCLWIYEAMLEGSKLPELATVVVEIAISNYDATVIGSALAHGWDFGAGETCAFLKPPVMMLRGYDHEGVVFKYLEGSQMAFTTRTKRPNLPPDFFGEHLPDFLVPTVVYYGPFRCQRIFPSLLRRNVGEAYFLKMKRHFDCDLCYRFGEPDESQT